jgi:uncharacterized membrane protein
MVPLGLMSRFTEYSRQIDPEGEHGHSASRIAFAAVGGAMALALATGLDGNGIEDVATTVVGASAGALLKNPLETLRANLYYWTCSRLGRDPDPTNLD